MPYTGNRPATHFENIPVVQRESGNGSTTSFTLDNAVSDVQDILVSVDGVVQDSNAYTLTNSTTIEFGSGNAPSSGTNNIFINFLGLTRGSVTPPAANKGNFKGDRRTQSNIGCKQISPSSRSSSATLLSCMRIALSTRQVCCSALHRCSHWQEENRERWRQVQSV